MPQAAADLLGTCVEDAGRLRFASWFVLVAALLFALLATGGAAVAGYYVITEVKDTQGRTDWHALVAVGSFAVVCFAVVTVLLRRYAALREDYESRMAELLFLDRIDLAQLRASDLSDAAERQRLLAAVVDRLLRAPTLRRSRRSASTDAPSLPASEVFGALADILAERKK